MDDTRLAKLVFADLEGDRRVRLKEGKLVPTAALIRKGEPICLLTRTLFREDDPSPPGFHVRRRQLAAVADGYDLERAFHFRGNETNPVIEATVADGGVTYAFHDVGSGHPFPGCFFCVPLQRTVAGACLGVHSDDRGVDAATFTEYAKRSFWNECGIALLTLKGVGDNEPVPIGAVLYAHNRRAKHSHIWKAWYDRRSGESIGTTFGYRAPDRRRPRSRCGAACAGGARAAAVRERGAPSRSSGGRLRTETTRVVRGLAEFL